MKIRSVGKRNPKIFFKKLPSVQKNYVFWNTACTCIYSLCNIIGQKDLKFFWSLLKWIFCLTNMGGLKNCWSHKIISEKCMGSVALTSKANMWMQSFPSTFSILLSIYVANFEHSKVQLSYLFILIIHLTLIFWRYINSLSVQILLIPIYTNTFHVQDNFLNSNKVTMNTVFESQVTLVS